VNRPVGFQEVRLQEDLKPVARQPLNGVVNGQNMDPLSVLDVGALGDGDHVAEANPEIVPDDPVHSDLFGGDGLVAEDNADGLLAFLALEQDGVATEKSQ